jgi:sugar transferase (PEP-CTERM/EpsH1 system associated)
MLAHRLPYPPHTGDKVRAYHVVRHLSRTHDVTLACLSDERRFEEAREALCRDVGDVQVAAIRPRAKRIQALIELARGRSATVAYFDSAELRARIARRGGDPFDLVYVSSSSMAQYLTELPRRPTVMDYVDIDSDKWLQYGRSLPIHKAWVYRLEARRLREQELAVARRADRGVVATDEEARLLRTMAPWLAVRVVPNGVDLDYFAPVAEPATHPTLVFAGVMNYLPNVDAAVYFCDAIFPEIRRRVPDARFVIVGRDPSSAVRRLASGDGVTVTGTVPDVRPHLREAAVSVAPLRLGRGIQNKVLEAMAMGLPVVATPTAVRGIHGRPGEHVSVTEHPGEFVEAVVQLLVNRQRRVRAGRAGRAYVERHHSWAASLARLDAVIEEATCAAAERAGRR